MKTMRQNQDGQALVETVLAIPIILLLFLGSVQMIQIGLAHIVVLDAAYEAGRQAHLDGNRLENGRRVAEEICRCVSSGPTEFSRDDQGKYVVTHHLHSIFPVLKNITIMHQCPWFLFRTFGEEDNS
jgi:hypothetical protein